MENLIRDVIDLQDQSNPRDTLTPIFRLTGESIPIPWETVKQYSQNIGHAFILGHTVNGVLGTANGIDGQQITLGSGGLGASTLRAVTSADNTFVEMLRTNEYVDTTLTTATVNTTSYLITF